MYEPTKQEEIDKSILTLIPCGAGLPFEGVSVADLAGRGIRVGTVRAALKRLTESNIIERSWEGNERYGRWLYRQPSLDRETVLAV